MQVQESTPLHCLAFQLPRAVLSRNLVRLTSHEPALSPMCFKPDGSVDKNTDFAMQFPTSLGKDICSKRAAFVGGTLISVEGDGNCLTRAMSVVCYGNEANHAALRVLYTGVVITNKDLHDFIPDFNKQKYMSEHFSPGGAWGSNVELEALGRALSLTIFVIYDHRDSAVVEICRYGPAACCLAYHDDNHYDVIGFRCHRVGVSDPQIHSAVAFKEKVEIRPPKKRCVSENEAQQHEINFDAWRAREGFTTTAPETGKPGSSDQWMGQWHPLHDAADDDIKVEIDVSSKRVRDGEMEEE